LGQGEISLKVVTPLKIYAVAHTNDDLGQLPTRAAAAKGGCEGEVTRLTSYSRPNPPCWHWEDGLLS